MILNVLYVAAGGAVGAVLRFVISLIPYKGDFPVLTLVTNLIGAFVIGFVVGMAEKNENMSKNTVLFLKTGLCGGFTTFSTFSLETLNLIDAGKYTKGIAYAGVSVILCIIGVYLGKVLAGVVVK